MHILTSHGTSNLCGIYIKNAAGSNLVRAIFSDTNLDCQIGATEVNTAITAATWYKLDFVFNLTTSKVTVSVNDVVKLNDLTVENALDTAMLVWGYANASKTGSLYIDEFEASEIPLSTSPRTALNRVPVSVSEPNLLGVDGAGNNVWTLQFKASRWE
jgi:hypothetical protein